MWGTGTQTPNPPARKTRRLDLSAMAVKATEDIRKAQGMRALKTCRCHGKCECELKAIATVLGEKLPQPSLMPSTAPHVTMYDRHHHNLKRK